MSREQQMLLPQQRQHQQQQQQQQQQLLQVSPVDAQRQEALLFSVEQNGEGHFVTRSIV